MTGAASLPSPIPWSPHPPGDPVRASRQRLPWRHEPAQFMLRADDPRAVRKPMSTAKMLRAVCLTLGFALLGSACTGPPRDAGRNGVRGGTLQVLSADDIDGLDTAVNYTPNGIGDRSRLRPNPVRLQPRGTARAEDRPGPRHRQRPPALGRPAHLHLHPAPRDPLRPPGRPRGHRRRLHHRHPAALRQDHPLARAAVRDLIAGATAFGAGKATRISGLTAPDARTLTITLDQPARDFLSILTHVVLRPGAR